MRETRIIMGMPITVAVFDQEVTQNDLEMVFTYFHSVDERFSTYKEGSEISRINTGEIPEGNYTPEMQEIFFLSEKTKQETEGYFDIQRPDGFLDPSGIVKGWAIRNATQLLLGRGHSNFYIEAGGDIASHGKNEEKKEWSIGIRNPFKQEEIVKVIYPHGRGIATSGSYIRGQHIYDPHHPEEKLIDIVSLTVIGPDVLEADRFATAAFAMGKNGIHFLEGLPAFEGYAIDARGMATMTSRFETYTTEISGTGR